MRQKYEKNLDELAKRPRLDTLKKTISGQKEDLRKKKSTLEAEKTLVYRSIDKLFSVVFQETFQETCLLRVFV